MNEPGCGCYCDCHENEHLRDWPGPCSGCCEPGDKCACGRALSNYGPEPEEVDMEREYPEWQDIGEVGA